VNRFDYRDAKPRSARVAALAAGVLIGAFSLVGCSAGQLSQTASQQSAVDGTHGGIKNVALRNVRIQAQQNKDFLRPGTTVDLVLVAINQSPDVSDKLVGISTDIGKVTVTGNATLPPGGTLFVGTPTGQSRTAAETVEAAETVRATVALAKPITNGPNYNFTFDFEKAGSVSLAVPVSAPEGPPLSAERP
jgi:copper(I)-binding protein